MPNAGVSVPTIVIYVSRKDHRKEPGILVATIAHEAAHAAGYLLDHVGQDYDGGSEAHAYLVGWFAKRIWQHVH